MLSLFWQSVKKPTIDARAGKKTVYHQGAGVLLCKVFTHQLPWSQWLGAIAPNAGRLIIPLAGACCFSRSLAKISLTIAAGSSLIVEGVGDVQNSRRRWAKVWKLKHLTSIKWSLQFYIHADATSLKRASLPNHSFFITSAGTQYVFAVEFPGHGKRADRSRRNK